MRIYLGLSGSEILLSESNRGIGFDRDEGSEYIITEDNSLHEYTTEEKKLFNFDYDKIKKTTYDLIETEYQRKATLVLKIEVSPNSGTYNVYYVKFIKPPKYSLWKEIYESGTKIRVYEGVSFSLREV